MRKIIDLFGNTVEVTTERWKHVCMHHPEIRDLFDFVEQTLKNPDLIKVSRTDNSVLMYYRFFENIFGGKYIIAIVKSNKRKFLLTAYVTDYIKSGEESWKRKN